MNTDMRPNQQSEQAPLLLPPISGRPVRAPSRPRMKPWLPEPQPDTTAQEVSVLPRRFRYLELALLALVLAVTLLIRVWELDKVPTDVMPDEADNLNSVYRILLGIGPGLFGFTWDGAYGAVNAYLQAAFVKLYGLDNTVVGIRMSSVVMSALAVIPFFFLIRRAFGMWVAFFTTLLFSSSWWYLNLSRTAWPLVFIVPCALMMLLLVEKALRAPTRRALLLFALAGVFVSLCLYGYPAAKVLVLALGVYLGIEWLIALFMRWRKSRSPVEGRDDEANSKLTRYSDDPTAPGELAPNRWYPPPPRPALIFGGSILVGLVALVVFLPQLDNVLKNWETYITRPRAVSIMAVQLPYEGANTWEEVYREQVRKVFDAWVLMRGTEIVPPGVQIRYNPPNEPFLDPVTRILFFLGLPLSLLTWRRSLVWWLFWVLGLAFIQVITTGVPDGARTVIIIPSVFYFVACAIFWIMKLLGYFARRRSTSLRSNYELRITNYESIPNPNIRKRVSKIQNRPAAPSRIVLALAALVCFGLVGYNVRHYWDWMHLPITSDARQPSVELDEFEEWQYFQWDETKKNSLAFTVDTWHIMRMQQPAGLIVAYYPAEGKEPPDWLRRGAPIALVDDSPIRGPQAFTVQWTGFLIAPQDGTYEFGCVSDGYCDLVLDGQLVLGEEKQSSTAGTDVTGTARLTQGPHRIAVQYKHYEPNLSPAFSFEWKPPGDGTRAPIPLTMLSPSQFTLGAQGP